MTNSAWESSVNVDGYRAREDEDVSASVNTVGPRYFSTMGIPVLAGREFEDRDGHDAPRVAVVSESFARHFFDHGRAIGRRVSFGRDEVFVEIVGIVQDARSVNMREDPQRFLYTPYSQHDDVSDLTFFVRTAGPPDALADVVRRAMRQRDPNLPVFGLKTMRAQVDDSLVRERMMAVFSAAFGALAALLAALGLYGVMAYTIARRTREIGVRMVLGADARMVMAMVLRDVAVLVAAGVAIGLPIALVATRVLRSQMFGLSPRDPATLAAAVAILAAAALVAGCAPARRAGRVDPISAMRCE
jgi:predicted permease